jgi:hypothetical protein
MYREIVEALKSIADLERTAGIGRYGINTESALEFPCLTRADDKKARKNPFPCS